MGCICFGPQTKNLFKEGSTSLLSKMYLADLSFAIDKPSDWSDVAVFCVLGRAVEVPGPVAGSQGRPVSPLTVASPFAARRVGSVSTRTRAAPRNTDLAAAPGSGVLAAVIRGDDPRV